MSKISKSVSVKQQIIVDLQLQVTINSFHNHNGFKEEQLSQAIEEFREEIEKELGEKLTGEYYQEEFLESVDSVSYKVEINY